MVPEIFLDEVVVEQCIVAVEEDYDAVPICHVVVPTALRRHRWSPAARKTRCGSMTACSRIPPPASMSVPLPPRPLLRLEFVVLVIIELVVEVVVVVEVFPVLVVRIVLVQLVVEVFVQVLILFEFLELFVDVVAATLERPLHRRCHGQHRHPQQRLELMETSPTTVPPASRCGPASGAPWRPARACAAGWTTASPRSTRRPRYTRAPVPDSPA